jgi:hypothetical protein
MTRVSRSLLLIAALLTCGCPSRQHDEPARIQVIQLGGLGGATPGASGQDGRSVGGGVGGKGGASGLGWRGADDGGSP